MPRQLVRREILGSEDEHPRRQSSQRAAAVVPQVAVQVCHFRHLALAAELVVVTGSP